MVEINELKVGDLVAIKHQKSLTDIEYIGYISIINPEYTRTSTFSPYLYVVIEVVVDFLRGWTWSRDNLENIGGFEDIVSWKGIASDTYLTEEISNIYKLEDVFYISDLI